MLSTSSVVLTFSPDDWSRWLREKGWDKPQSPAVRQLPEPQDLGEATKFERTLSELGVV